LLAALSVKYPVKELISLRLESFTGHYAESQQLIPVLISQFRGDEGTTASRYFAANILERMSHTEPEIDQIVQLDFECVVRTLFTYCPQSQSDRRPETRLAILLSSLILNVWRRLAEKQIPDHAILFSQVLMPLFEVMDIKSDGNPQSHLVIVQSLFIEMLRHIGSFEDLGPSVKSEQMKSILEGFAKSSNQELVKEATETLAQLNF
jgi:hypothetical protein